MALEKRTLLDAPQIVCTSDDCGSTTFEIAVEESGQVVLNCDLCGEAYTLEYVMQVINGEVE